MKVKVYKRSKESPKREMVAADWITNKKREAADDHSGKYDSGAGRTVLTVIVLAAAVAIMTVLVISSGILTEIFNNAVNGVTDVGDAIVDSNIGDWLPPVWWVLWR